MPFPLVAAGALLAPLVGGAMSLAGGALSLTGGLTHAASTASGMVWDMGKGIMGGLGGEDNGKSGNVEEEPRAPDPLGGRALPPGTKLNSAGVIVYDKGSSRGGQIIGGQTPGMTLEERIDSIGPVDRSDASPLQRILDHVIHISTNTDRISAGIGLLVAGQTAQTAVQQSQTAIEKRESGLEGAETGPKGPGAISRGLSKTWGGIKKTLGSVGDGLKMALKAIALGGAFVLYKKYRENIKEWMANIFETFDYWYHEIKESKSPFKTAWEGIKTMAADSFVWLKEKTVEFLDMMFNILWETAKSWVFGAKGEKRIVQEAKTGIAGRETMQRVISETSAGSVEDWWENTGEEGVKLKKHQRTAVYTALKDTLGAMKEISDQSDGRIQWTGIDRDLSKLAYFKIDTIPDMANTLGQMLATPSMILDSKPIIDGFVSTWDVVNNLKPGDLNKMGGITKTMPESTQKDITSELAKRSILKNQLLTWQSATEDNEPGWLSWLKPDAKFEKRKANAIKELQGQLDANLAQELGQQFPDKPLADKFHAEGLNGKSISTHDHHLEELLKPVSKAFADGKQTPAVVMAPDNRNQSVTKLGDTYSGGLSSRVQDNTALMLAYTKNLNSTTGQFA